MYTYIKYDRDSMENGLKYHQIIIIITITPITQTYLNKKETFKNASINNVS